MKPHCHGALTCSGQKEVTMVAVTYLLHHVMRP